MADSDEATRRDIAMLKRDLSSFAGKAIGSLRIDMGEVRAILATIERIEQLEARSSEQGEREALLREYQQFAGETAGKCLALAMSDKHPAPDEVLMGIFQASQDLAAKARATPPTTSPNTPPTQDADHVA